MRKKQLIGKKPAYFQGQLLLKDDFIDEQKYHINERARHSLNLHGWGVVRGLDVTATGDTSITISSGFAIDGKGREIAINEPEVLELSAFAPSSLLQITVSYETEQPSKDRPRIDCYGVLAASTGIEEAAVVLATVQLDDRGKLRPESISTATRRVVRTILSPGSVNAAALDPSLRTGWLRVPFRPTTIPQDTDPKKEGPPPPPFRVGATEARSHREIDGQPNTKGAGGTMAIPLPPGITHVHRLRVAGQENEKKIKIELFRGGWDPTNKKHIGGRDDPANKLLETEISGGPYDETYAIKEGELDPVTSTLSIDIRSTGYVRVSLVAVEISY
ncbi:hypothetical protein [Nitrosovibrio tenuis]|uniref:Uncharacterized protein n=1 Tax=Nitrosovibrio tenuis TaxID=1233 RepID=A0A1H7MN32_9PROT|nr:hypothetical protein [Nitrosovibrio tenuis]SEL12278.1 hypothetical protein SAMN05216387_105136 [Nitrosovibrio tenuis]